MKILKMFLKNLLHLKKCCGCVSLKTGCIIIGSVETAGNIYGLINSLIKSESFEEIILFIPISIFLMLINIIMLFGVHMEKKKLLLPWIISKFLFYLVITIIFAMRAIETFLMIPDFIEFEYKIFISLLFGGVTVLLLLAWHSFLCVYSFYSISSVSDVTDKTEKKTQ